MKFVSIRIITADVARLVAFYEKVTASVAVWGNELFAEIPTPVGALAIGRLLFRDPDGNLVNLFTPVTDDARAKFGLKQDTGV
jgi:hypothetical protein